MNKFARKLAMITSYHRNRFLLITRFLMELRETMYKMWIGNLGRQIVWYHFQQSINAFGDGGKC